LIQALGILFGDFVRLSHDLELEDVLPGSHNHVSASATASRGSKEPQLSHKSMATSTSCS